MSWEDDDAATQQDAGSFEGGFNEFPDGEYNVRITFMELRRLPDKGLAFVEAQLKVVDGPEADSIGRNSWCFRRDSQDGNKMSKMALNSFNDACGQRTTWIQFEDKMACAAYEGIILNAKKITKVSNGKTFVNWKYFKLVSKPEVAKEEIDLDEDPFAEEIPDPVEP